MVRNVLPHSDVQITQSAHVADVTESGTHLTNRVHVHKVNENELL